MFLEKNSLTEGDIKTALDTLKYVPDRLEAVDTLAHLCEMAPIGSLIPHCRQFPVLHAADWSLYISKCGSVTMRIPIWLPILKSHFRQMGFPFPNGKVLDNCA